MKHQTAMLYVAGGREWVRVSSQSVCDLALGEPGPDFVGLLRDLPLHLALSGSKAEVPKLSGTLKALRYRSESSA
jgi:hypothetical protein